MKLSRRAGQVKNHITQGIATKGEKLTMGGTLYSQDKKGQVVRLTPKYSKGVMK